MASTFRAMDVGGYSPIDVRKLRQQSIFGGDEFPSPYNPMGDVISPQEAQSPDVPQPVKPNVNPGVKADNQVDIRGLIDLINNSYTPDVTSRDRFNKLLDEFPQRESPGIARRIVAGGMGLGSKDPLQTMEGVMNAPYIRDVASWKERAGPYQQAAQLENQANVNERTLMGNAITAEMQGKRYDRQFDVQEERNRITESNNKMKNDVAKLRNIAYQAAIRNRAIKFDFSGPYVIMTDENGVTNTGVETGKMDEMDRIELQNLGRVEAAKQAGTNATNRALAAGTGQVVVGGVVHQYNPDTDQYEPVKGLPRGTPTRVGTPQAGRATPEDTAARVKLRKQQALKDIWNSDPDSHPFIQYDAPSDTYTLKQKKSKETFGGIFGTNDKERAKWDEIQKKIEPDYRPPDDVGPNLPPGMNPDDMSLNTGRGGEPPSTGIVGGGRGMGPGTADLPGSGRDSTGRGGGPAVREVARQYSPSRNQTRIIYSDGTTKIFSGRQD